MNIHLKCWTDVTDKRNKVGQQFHIRLVVDTEDSDEWYRIQEEIKKAISTPQGADTETRVLGLHQSDDDEEDGEIGVETPSGKKKVK